MPREPHFDQTLVCGHCNTSTHAHCSFALLASTHLLAEIRHDDDPVRLPLQTAVTRYVQHLSHNPHFHHCSRCSGPFDVDALTIPDLTWVWFELADHVSPISPSLRIVFGTQDQQQVYNLQAIIYSGANHFTARFFDRANTWWNYNDMWRFGTLCEEQIKFEPVLPKNGDLWAAFLLYIQVDPFN
jgi:hypothetical protein